MIRRTHNDEQARFCGLFYWANEIDQLKTYKWEMK